MDLNNLYSIISRTSLENVRNYHQGKFGAMLTKLLDYNCISDEQKPIYEFFGKITTALEGLDENYRKFSLSLSAVELVQAIDYATNNSDSIEIPKHKLIEELENAWSTASEAEQEDFPAMLSAFQALDILVLGTAPELEQHRAEQIRNALSSNVINPNQPIQRDPSMMNDPAPYFSNVIGNEDLLLELEEKYQKLKSAYDAFILNKKSKVTNYRFELSFFDTFIDFTFLVKKCEQIIADASVLNNKLSAIYNQLVIDKNGEIAKIKKDFDEISSTSKAISRRLSYQTKYVPYEINQFNPEEIEAYKLSQLGDKIVFKGVEKKIERLKDIGKRFPRAYYYIAIWNIHMAVTLEDIKNRNLEKNYDTEGFTLESSIEQTALYLIKYFFETYRHGNQSSLYLCLHEIFSYHACYPLTAKCSNLLPLMISKINLMITDESDVEAAKFFVEEANNFYIGKSGKDYSLKRKKLNLISLDKNFKGATRGIIFAIQSILSVLLMFIAAAIIPFNQDLVRADLEKLMLLSVGLAILNVLSYLLCGNIARWNRLVIPVGGIVAFALAFIIRYNDGGLDIGDFMPQMYLVTLSPAIALCFTKPYKFRAVLFNLEKSDLLSLLLAVIWGAGLFFLLWANRHILWFLEILIYIALGAFVLFFDTYSYKSVSHLGERLFARALVLLIVVSVALTINMYIDISCVALVMTAVTILMYPAYGILSSYSKTKYK